MLRFQVITLFPELFEQFRAAGLMSRALEEGHASLETIQLRDYAINSHGQVDDSPYGGGSGMVLRPEPAVAAIEEAKRRSPNSKVILLSPRGRPLTQSILRALVADAKRDDGGFIMLCPRYEGVDQRICDHFVDIELSVGDYILMGGELPAMTFIEASCRLLDGVLGNPESAKQESFTGPLLEHSQYTKPQVFRDLAVPEPLLSGNHASIESWRTKNAQAVTVQRRPELLNEVKKVTCEVTAALIHYPVVDKTGKVVTSSITNIDLHDIARSARTFGIERFYIVHPTKALRRLAEKINTHWLEGYGFTYNPNRGEALALISLVPDLDDVIIDIENRTGKPPKIITTSAKRERPNFTTYHQMRGILRTETDPHLVLFGTGWGMCSEIFDRAQYLLEPINGPTDYNHLSVRGAAAITFDRLLAPK